MTTTALCHDQPQTMSGQQITVENCGPICGLFTIDISGPGVYELRGDKGSGKSTILRSVELLSGHKVDLTVHDGELSGQVSGFGVVAPVGSKKRTRGDFELHALDSERFSINDITDPPIKNPAAADAHRVKALAALCGAVANPSDYWELVGGQKAFEQLVPATKLETDDPVLLASRVKDAFDTAARLAESEEKFERGHAQACADRVANVDLKGPHDAKELNEAVDRAVALESQLREQKRNAEEGRRQAEKATRELEHVREEYRGPSVERAQAEQARADAEVKSTAEQCTLRKRALDEAKKAFDEAVTANREAVLKQNTAVQATKAAIHHVKMLAQCEATIQSHQAVAVEPSAGQIADASNVTQQARTAQERGVLIRDALKARDQEKQHLEAAARAAARADQLRSAAKGTFDVLTRSVKLRAIKIESVQGDARLVVNHPRRGKTLFAELSDGERVLSTIDEISGAISSPGIFPVSQRIWQDLPPHDRRAVDKEAKKRGLIVFAAQVDEGPLRVERYQEVE